jgi:hypothetical protein
VLIQRPAGGGRACAGRGRCTRILLAPHRFCTWMRTGACGLCCWGCGYDCCVFGTDVGCCCCSLVGDVRLCITCRSLKYAAPSCSSDGKGVKRHPETMDLPVSCEHRRSSVVGAGSDTAASYWGALPVLALWYTRTRVRGEASACPRLAHNETSRRLKRQCS